METKVCKECCGEFDTSFFSISRSGVGSNGKPTIFYKTICKGCEEKNRLSKQAERPFHKKAYHSLKSHAEEDGLTLAQFEKYTGVTVDYAEGLFREAWILERIRVKGTYPEPIGVCHSCGKAFKHKKGFDDYTIDRRDTSRPLTRSNIWLICAECNSGKGAKDSTKFDIDSKNWRKYNERLKEGGQITLSSKEPILNQTIPLIL